MSNKMTERGLTLQKSRVFLSVDAAAMNSGRKTSVAFQEPTAPETRTIVEPVEVMNYRVQFSQGLARPIVCPRCENDVFALAAHLQYYIGAKYLELADYHKRSAKRVYMAMAIRQLDRKDQIAALANARLNRQLRVFYNNGGPVIDLPVAEATAALIQPAFEQIIASFTSLLDEIASPAGSELKKPSDVEKRVNSLMIDMFTAIGAMYRDEEVHNAFADLVKMRKA
ncbi:MAG: hypothetical protein ACM3QZ_01530 [Solirubrobacterales bacterium]